MSGEASAGPRAGGSGDDSMWGGGVSVFYTIVFAGVAVLLVVAVIVQRSRKK